ncbi:NAD(P)/FAD-dependent oxidoreductase [Pseudogemmobacter sonorensis]|uniref:NAD(P)/FAD-dependent oxidoreductase n=1 Tax=Pseudogemmobacter sonorensis TaxID=2989681 RepID=UPI003675A477
MRDFYDVIIVGGAVMGSCTAYWLAANSDFDGKVLLIERDPTYATSSTALSAAGIRVQFSNKVNVQIGQFGTEFIRDFPDLMEVDGDRPTLGYHPGGYLFLANTEAQVRILRQNHEVQRTEGADVVLWDADRLKWAFPHLRVDDILLASYGNSGEGWFDNTGIMAGARRKARALGVDVVSDEVVGITRDGNRVTGVTLKSGARVGAGTIVNAAGPRGGKVAHMAGLDLPVEPRKRTLFVYDTADTPEGTARVNEGRLPLMVDPTGVWCRPEGRFFVAGGVPRNDIPPDYDDFEPDHPEWEDQIWPALAERSGHFEALKIVRSWAGHYDYNTFDQNGIVGRHPEVTNFIFQNGFSGHGLQQGPAVGRAVMELITYGGYRTLDLSDMWYERIAENKRFLEQAIV